MGIKQDHLGHKFINSFHTHLLWGLVLMGTEGVGGEGGDSGDIKQILSAPDPPLIHHTSRDMKQLLTTLTHNRGFCGQKGEGRRDNSMKKKTHYLAFELCIYINIYSVYI